MSTPVTGLLRRLSLSARASVAFLVHSNVFISMASASVTVTTMCLADFPLSLGPPFIVFAVTMFVYSADRILDIDEDEQNVPRRAAFTRRYGQFFLGLGILLYVGALGVALALDIPGTVFLLMPLLVTILYSAAGLKRYFLVKNLLVGVSWGLIPLGVGVYFHALWHPEVWFLFGYVTSMLTVAAMIFDIKDIDGDRAEGIATVPTRYGPATTRRLAQALNVAIAGVVVGLVVAGLLPTAYLALLAFHLYVGCYIVAATPDRGTLFYGFIVDGEHLFLALVVVTLDVLVHVFGG